MTSRPRPRRHLICEECSHHVSRLEYKEPHLNLTPVRFKLRTIITKHPIYPFDDIRALFTDITEVQFAPNAQTSESTNSSGLTVSEYVAIGISSLLLGLIYVASVFLFLHIRKRRKAMSDEDGNRIPKGLKKKDGSVITERDIVRVNNERIQNLPNAMGQDDGIVKKNPLLTISRQIHENKNFPTDSGSNLSDSDDFGDNSVRSEENLYNVSYNFTSISFILNSAGNSFYK